MSDAAAIIADLLSSGHAVQFQVRGDSMYPLIRDGDSLHVEPLDRVQVGDVVLVLAGRGLTAHRVIAIRNGMVITRGDNAPAADDAVPVEKVMGRVTSTIRGGRRLGVGSVFGRVVAFLRQRLR